MSKYIEKRICELSKELEALGQETLADCKFEAFAQKRSIINLHIISMLSGAKMGTGLDDPKMRFSGLKQLPNMEEIAKICELLSAYITTYENPYRAGGEKTNGTDDENFDDIAIPQDSPRYGVLNKLTSKTFKEFVLGPDEYNIGAAGNYITAEDVIRIAGFGETLRKKKIRNAVFIIGGISLVVVGGVVITSIIRKKNSEKDETVDGIDVPTIDLSDENADVPVMDDDVPVVTID